VVTGTEAYIVAATRTPVGRRNGGLAAAHPADLAAHVLVEALSRAAVDADAVDDVIMGCVDQAGAQASNIARVAVLSAGLPHAVPATTPRSSVTGLVPAARFHSRRLRWADENPDAFRLEHGVESG
jgi:Thiolase, N-terminal domain